MGNDSGVSEGKSSLRIISQVNSSIKSTAHISLVNGRSADPSVVDCEGILTVVVLSSRQMSWGSHGNGLKGIDHFSLDDLSQLLVDGVSNGLIEEVDDGSIELSEESGDLKVDTSDMDVRVSGLEAERVSHRGNQLESGGVPVGSKDESVVELQEQEMNTSITLNNQVKVLDTELNVTFFEVGNGVLGGDTRTGNFDVEEINILMREVGDGDGLDLVNEEVQEGVLEGVDDLLGNGNSDTRILSVSGS